MDDVVTGVFAEVEVVTGMPVDRVWSLVTDVGRTGEWSPECVYAAWLPGQGEVPYAGARFGARNSYADGFTATVACVVIEAVRPEVFAWVVLDDARDAERPGSAWRYALEPAGDGTRVRQRFTHGPGLTGLRAFARDHPGRAAEAVEGRLAELRANMRATLRAMLDPPSGSSPYRT
ncbi:SRPBCC family protein [Actinomadura sp. DC4]|uniref:SRPBCC family protein n=1 Tax=Actinomadura sp. DC4 TaxID=3055069 RepID=UPI0025AF82CA|nr:SRPBCC family protein [Actinomadura sp. DC4]MDN3356328.1 SRPBCC family protein [Actinomadura sp. DC4]